MNTAQFPGVSRSNATTIVECLSASAREHPHKIAVHCIADDGSRSALTYAQLERRSLAVARVLMANADARSRALILLPTGMNYLAAFFGALYAGLIAVPAYPFESRRTPHLERLLAMLSDASPRVLLTDDAGFELAQSRASEIDPPPNVINLDAISEFDIDDSVWYGPLPAVDDIAFLQYTSGSTSLPKGVMVSHGNLIANEVAISRFLGTNCDDTAVSWLPLYHDMGLIGCLLQAIYAAVPLVLMSPRYFLERPVRWLEAISEFRATLSGGPDFAYRLCVERVRGSMLSGLDLSHWRVAFSGSEPIRPDTLQQFCEHFEPAGFSARSCRPCYGLAEATLYVSGECGDAGAMTLTVDAAALAASRIESSVSGVTLASCGQHATADRIAIMDDSMRELADNLIGEICVCGPSVAMGYWQNPEATAATFVECDGQRFLRTGDLGFRCGDQLFVTGRIKDVIIIRGQNLYPQDIERIVEDEVELVRKSRVAAFALDIDGTEVIGIAAEVGRSVQKVVAPDVLARTISECIAAAIQEPAGLVLLLNPGALPKTSSGKLQRSACRKDWLSGDLDLFAAWQRGVLLTPIEGVMHEPVVSATSLALETSPVAQTIARVWCDVLGVEPRPQDNFFALGGSSIKAVELIASMSVQLDRAVELRVLFEAPVFQDFVAAATADGSRLDAILPAAKADAPVLQSYAQSRLWFFTQLEPDSDAYNVAAALCLRGKLQQEALQRALTTLAERHAPLRTTFDTRDGQSVQHIHAPAAVAVATIDLRMDARGDRANRLKALIAAAARRPFDLRNDLPLRALLVAMDDDDWALIVTSHHIAVDGWSTQILLRELASCYASYSLGEAVTLMPLPIAYADYAQWQRQWLDAGAAAQQLAYWRAQLGETHEALELPTDRTRPLLQSYRGEQCSVHIDAEIAAGLRDLAQKNGATLFVVLLTAFNILLYRLSGSRDLRVGVPVANRQRPETAGLIGFFVNTLVMRTRISGEDRYEDLLRRVRQTVFDAQARQDLPFEKIVEVLQPERSLAHNPLCQVKFNLGFAAPALPDFGGLVLEQFTTELPGSRFDLALDLAEQADGAIAGAFTYATDLFDTATIERWNAVFTQLLRALTTGPDRRIAEFTLPSSTVLHGEQVSFDFDDVVTMIRAHRETDPQVPALRNGAQIWTRADLDAAVGRVARILQHRGVAAETPVALCAERSPAWVIGFLGILKAGCACVPLDPAQPIEHLRGLIENVGAQQIVGVGSTAHALAADVIDIDTAGDGVTDPVGVQIRVRPSQLACIIHTSGSTGRPKAVAVTHGALANYVQGILARLPRPANAAMAMVSSVSADLGHTTLFGALCGGHVLCLADADCAFDPDRFADFMCEHEVAALKIVPSHLRGLLQAADPAAVLPTQLLILGGEAADSALIERVRELRPQCRIINHYGPTETTVGVLTHAVAADANNASLGTPLANQSAVILDGDLNAVPDGAAGELFIGGAGVARGYLGQPALTAERFVPNPKGDGERLYRSGDRVRLRGGAIEFLGRCDDQLKIRGFRVEPEEVAAGLRKVPGVVSAAVVAAADDTRGTYLIGYCECEDAGNADPVHVRAALLDILPEYLIPAFIVPLAKLPLTANGKLDRRALPRPSTIAGDEAPMTALEQQLAQIWRDVLQLEHIGASDNFFVLGGDSILSLQIVARARKAGLRLTPKQIFEGQTIRALASLLGESASVREISSSAPPRVDRSRPLPLSHAQSRLWFLWQLEPDNSVYNVTGSLHLRGELDGSALQHAFTALVARHEALRTVFPKVDGNPVQFIKPAEPVPIPVQDLSAMPAAQRTRCSDELIEQIAHTRFDLVQGPLLKVQLIRLDEREHLLLIAMHHIVSDGWSVNVFIDEFAKLYAASVRNQAAALPALPIQYADYASWQRRWLDSGEAELQLTYWREKLDGTAPLPLLADKPRPAVQSYRGASHPFVLRGELVDALRRFAAQRQVTLSTVLLAGFVVLLHRRGGAEDIRIGLPVANRRWVETEGLIGFFVNMIVVRADLAAAPDFAELLAQLARTTTDAQLHQDLPFEQLVEILNPERSLAQHPLFQITYNHRRRDFSALRSVAELDIDEPTPFSGVTQFDLTLNTEEIGGELRNSFTYSTDLFQASTIAQMADQFAALLQAVLGEPERAIAQLSLCAQPRAGESAAPAGASLACLHQLFEQRAVTQPAATALVWSDGAMTYVALNALANQLARKLRAAGVDRENLVGVCAARGPLQVVAQLASVKAGAAYLPLDPFYPKERLALMLADAAPRIVLADADGLRQLADLDAIGIWNMQSVVADLESFAATDLNIPVASTCIAYCIYTSGSTGRPKGVLISHAAAVNHMQWMQKTLRVTPADRILQKTPFSFDASVWEFWLPLSTGASCLLAPVEASRDPALLWQFAAANGATVLQVVPSLLRALLDDPACANGLKGLRHLCCGGEMLPVDLVDAVRRKWRGEMWNLYGPTETTIDAAFWRCDMHDDNASIPVGHAVDNLTLHVLDIALNPVPAGVLGEIYIGGIGVARGYLNRTAATAERFVPDPFATEPGARLYRSGDRGRWRGDGAIECVGRIDQQVKLRGYRIEPGEIEGTLRSADLVRDAVVVAREGASGNAQLIAYVTADIARLKSLPRAADSEALVGEWETVFDDAYTLEGGGPSFTGWNSSYTDAPIPAVEMQAWLDDTVARIARGRPQRLLEIGCGIGLLLQHLAPLCTRYRGTDLSAQALAELRAWLQRAHPQLTHIQLEHREAANFSGIDAGAFDAVVVNSVVQYFPDIDYLLRVLDGAARVLDAQGFLFVGDIRHFGLLPAFHTSVQWFRASPELTATQLRQRIGQAVTQEKELVIDPAFFQVAAMRLGFGGVSIALKRSDFANELSKYRYDVTLHKTASPAAISPLTWQPGHSSPEIIAAELARRPERLLVVGIPNRRIARDLAMSQLLQDSDPRRRFAELDAELAALPMTGEDPEQFWALAERCGYAAHISWTPAAPECFDVEFTAPDARPSARAVPMLAEPVDWSTCATDPLRQALAAQWGPQLREWLQQRLPDYMVPSHVVVLDAMPLMPNGKIDRAALPVPDAASRQREYTAPRNATEIQLAQIWQDVLQLGRVGIHDNFFELGGHSLLATQVVSRLRDSGGVVLPLRRVFEHPTLAALAQAVDDSRGAALDEHKLARFDLLLQEEGL